MKIYLSPSKQPANLYKVGSTNEMIQMTRLVHALKPELERFEGVEVKVATESLSPLKLDGRTKEAIDFGADIYIPVHSNAGGTTARGPQVYMGSKTPTKERVAAAMLTSLKSVTPGNDPAARVVWNNPYNFAEIRMPERYGMTTYYLEVEYHDKEDTAKWIIDNIDLLARAVAEGFAHGYGLKTKQEVRPGTPAGGGKAERLFRVQIGAFTVRANAENRLNRARVLFPDAFIATADINGKTFYRVQIGAFYVRYNAEQQLQRARTYFPDAFIQEEEPADPVDYEQIAAEVWAGIWGNEPERSKRLTAAGYDYEKVKAAVNRKQGGR